MVDYSLITPPFRLAVLRALTSELKGIHPDADFVHDLRDFESGGRTEQRVFRGRAIFGAGDPLPMLSVLEDPRQDKGGDRITLVENIKLTEWDVAIMGFVEDEPDNPTDSAHYLAADVVRKLAQIRAQGPKAKIGRPGNILGFGDYMPCVSEVKYGDPVVRPATEGVSDTGILLHPGHDRLG